LAIEKESAEVIAQDEKKSDKSQDWRKVQEGVPLKHVSYPHAPSRREVERQFIRFTKILKNLQINIPLTEAMQQMPTYACFLKELLAKKRKFPEEVSQPDHDGAITNYFLKIFKLITESPL